MGWAITFNYDNTVIANESQKEPKNGTLVPNIIPVETSINKTILVLVFTGFIGLFGIRRQGKKQEILKKINQPESKEYKNFLHENNL